MVNRRTSRQLILVTLFLIALLVLISCGSQSTFEAKGEVARRQLDLFWIIFGFGVFVFIVVEGALIYSALRYRRKPGQGLPSQIHGNPKLEVAWTIAPALVLVGIAIPTLIVIFNTSADAGPDITKRAVQTVTDPEKEISLADAQRFKEGAVLGEVIDIRVKVDVTAHQWWWEFRYPELGVATANELHVPVNHRIDVTLTSDDVIHSFWIPNLMGKVDVIPRNVNETWFVADEPGTYKGQCAEFCGTAHAQMRFRVIVQTQEDFDKWVEDYKKPPVEATGEAAQGAALFASKGCILCHSKDGPETLELRASQREAFLRGDPVVPGPNLTHFATRNTMAAGITSLTESDLVRWLTNPDDVKPGNRMAERAAVYNDPALALTEDEVSALAAFLLTLYPAPVAVSVTPTPVVQPTPTPTLGPGTPEPPTPTPSPTPSGVAPGDPAVGRQVFQTASPIACNVCHSLDGTVGLGPSLQGIASKAVTRVSGLSAEEYIRQSILDPTAFLVEGFSPVMPTTFGTDLTPQQLEDVIAFLLTLE